MRALGFAMAFATVTLAAAHADDVSQSRIDFAESNPRSIWQIDVHGDALHLESGLVCQGSIGAFHRTSTIIYNRSGLDVSCGYSDDKRTILTIYLTRRHGQSLLDDFDAAKRGLLARTPSASPLSDAQQAVFNSDIQWQRLIYSEQDGQIHSGIWIGDLHGWTLEFRATYAAENETAALAGMSALTGMAEATAGSVLAVCEKSSIPVRTGTLITSKDTVEQSLLLASLLGAVVPDPKAPAPRKITWCVESELTSSDVPMLLWHGAYEDGSDASSDKVTVDTVGDPPTLLSARDEMGSIVEGETTGKKDLPVRWIASTKNGNRTTLYAVFSGRPDAGALAGLMADILNGKAKAIGGYGNDGSNTTIELPAESK